MRRGIQYAVEDNIACLLIKLIFLSAAFRYLYNAEKSSGFILSGEISCHMFDIAFISLNILLLRARRFKLQAPAHLSILTKSDIASDIFIC